MKTVLLIGAPGNISTTTIEMLIERGFCVMAFTLPKTNRQGLDEKIKFYEGNRNNSDSLKAVLEEVKPEIVIDYSCFTPEQCKQTAELLKDKVEQYVLLSTVDVYGYPLSQLPMPENGVWGEPNCVYAADKKKCEDILSLYTQKQLPRTIIRPAYSMGNHFMLTALSRDGGSQLVARLRAHKPIFSPGDGTALIHVSSAYNTGKMIACVIDDPRAVSEDFTCGNDSVMTYDDYINLISEVVGEVPNIVHVPSDFVYSLQDIRVNEVLLNDLTRHNVFFDVTKFKRFYPSFKWEKSIRDTIKDFVDCQDRENNTTYVKGSFEDFVLEKYMSLNKESCKW